MTRIFRSSDIREAFLAKLNRGYYGDLVDRVNPPGALGGAIQDEHGSMVFTGARLDVATLLEEMHLRFDQQSVLCREPFQHQEMRFEAGGRVMWRGQEFSAVIFCEGSGVVANPWFNWIPIAPIKGQILTIRENSSLKRDMRALFGDYKSHSLQKSCWIASAGDRPDCWKVGATYERKFEGMEPNDLGTKILLEKLRDLSSDWGEPEVVGHIAGTRPCSEDKKPIIGPHPVIENLYCFNGFGSKGCLWIPFWARRLAGILDNSSSEKLDSDVHVRRYFKRYDSTNATSA